MMPLRTFAAGYALGEYGRNVREEGPNWSPRIAEYAANLTPPWHITPTSGQPWCAMVIQFVTDEACRLAELENPLDGVELEALVQSYADWADARAREEAEREDAEAGYIARIINVPAALVEMGDLVLYRFSSGPPRWNHIGMVIDPPGTLEGGRNLFRAFEGNTGSQGGRDGDGVYIKRRSIDAPYPIRFVRWDDGLIYRRPEERGE